MTGTSLRGPEAAIYPAPWMADNPEHSHLITFPEALEALFSRMGELKVVLGPAAAAEGAMMRAIAERFRQALARGAFGEAKETADVMRARSGSVLTPKKPR